LAKPWSKDVNFPVALAPMVGLSHVALRMMVRRYLPANAKTFWPTEMLSSWRLEKEQVGSTPETFRHAQENGLCPQILGNEEIPIRTAVQRLADWGAEAIDINMGCPVRKALKHNYGVALMGDADYAAKVVDMTVRNSKLPVSVKLRAGMQNDREYLLKFTKGLAEAGAAWVTLHPRVAADKRRGRADWSQIQFLQNELPIPVIGNGDVQTVDDVFAMLEQTDCSGVMVGRALTARPWLLWQVGKKMGFENPPGFEGEPPTTPLEEGAEYGRALNHFTETLREYFSEEDGMKRLKFFVRVSMVWLEFGQTLWANIAACKTYDEALAAAERFFSMPQRMTGKTQLRE
jgi:nifR3 family TIM-barrel protein